MSLMTLYGTYILSKIKDNRWYIYDLQSCEWWTFYPIIVTQPLMHSVCMCESVKGQKKKKIIPSLTSWWKCLHLILHASYKYNSWVMSITCNNIGPSTSQNPNIYSTPSVHTNTNQVQIYKPYAHALALWPSFRGNLWQN